MTLQQMTEEVQQLFPQLSYTQIRFDLNAAIKEFGQKAGLPYAETTLTKASAYVSFDSERDEYKWTLPSDVYEIRNIDTSYRDEIRVDTTNLYLDFIGTDLTKIRIEYVKVPTTLSLLTDESNIPQVFHTAIVARVIEKWYSIGGNQPGTQYFRSRWNDAVKEAKNYHHTRPWRNSSAVPGGSGGSGISGESGRRIRGRLALVTGKNIVTVGAPGPALVMGDAQYILMLNGNGVWVTAVNPETGLIERTTTTFNVWSADNNANFEYTIEGV